jgi:hypothetical protein
VARCGCGQLGLVLIASIYIGFAVADGRATVIAVESTVAAMFVIVASAAVTVSPWLLVLRLPATGQGSLAAPPEVCANSAWWPAFGRIGEAVGDLQMSTRCIGIGSTVGGDNANERRFRIVA